MSGPFRDFVDVQLYAALADGGSVGRAARSVGMSQPAASKRLHDIQRRSSALLYELGPRGTVLTSAGEFWASEARSLLRLTDDAAERFRAGGWAHNPLNLCVSHIVADYLLPGWLKGWRTSDSRACHVEVGNSEVVRRSVACGRVELGILQTSESDLDGLHSTRLLPDHLVVIVAKDHPWARANESISIQEFVQTPLVCREASSGTQSLLGTFAKDVGLPMTTPKIQVQSTMAVRSAVMRGIAPGVLPGIAVRDDLRKDRLAAVDVDGFDIRVWVSAIFTGRDILTQAAAAFLRHVSRVTGVVRQ